MYIWTETKLNKTKKKKKMKLENIKKTVNYHSTGSIYAMNEKTKKFERISFSQNLAFLWNNMENLKQKVNNISVITTIKK